MAACSALGKARIWIGMLVNIGWWGFYKMSVPGIAPNLKARPWLDRSRPVESKNPIFGKKTLVFYLYFAILKICVSALVFVTGRDGPIIGIIGIGIG